MLESPLCTQYPFRKRLFRIRHSLIIYFQRVKSSSPAQKQKKIIGFSVSIMPFLWPNQSFSRLATVFQPILGALLYNEIDNYTLRLLFIQMYLTVMSNRLVTFYQSKITVFESSKHFCVDLLLEMFPI